MLYVSLYGAESIHFELYALHRGNEQLDGEDVAFDPVVGLCYH